MSYNALVCEHFFHPRQTDTIDASQPFFAMASVGSLKQGDAVELSLVCDEAGVIKDIGFKAYGNPYLIAALSWLCEQSKGEELDRVCQKVAEPDLFTAFEIPTSRVYSVFIIEDVFNNISKTIAQNKRANHES